MFITAATDAMLQGFFYEVGLLSDFSWEEVMGAAMTGALAPGAGSSTGIGGIMKDAAHFKNITAVAEAAGIVALENTTIQLASMAVGIRKHFSIREVLTSVATFVINGMANAEIDLIPQSKLLNAVEKSLADAGFDELYGSAIMGRDPSLESALDQFAMNLGNYVGQAIADEIKVASEPKEQKSSAYRPIDAYAETKRAIQELWAQSYAQSTPSHDTQSLDNASQAHDTTNNKGFSYGDWYKDTLVYAKAVSHFNKSEAASGFINPANDFAGYMNMLTDQVIPIPGPEYRHYAESSPTSTQAKVVDHETGWTHAAAIGKGVGKALVVAPLEGIYELGKELVHDVAHPVETVRQRIAMLRFEYGLLGFAVHNPSAAYQMAKTGFVDLGSRIQNHYQGLTFDQKLEFWSFAGTSVIAAVASAGASAEVEAASAGSLMGKVNHLMPKLSEMSVFGAESLVSSGGRQFKTVRANLNADEEAALFYEKMRSNPSNVDVALISKSTGMPEFQIQRIKQHVFFDTHKLSYGIDRFAPDIEIADAWTRLQRGNFVKEDLQLLQHEYFEARFKGIFKTDYMTAHNAANDSLRTWNPHEFITTPEMSWRP
jgi:hypothetical protein